MAIISAGVIMNIILAVGCYAYMFTKPRQEPAAALGAVSAGSLAYDAGLRPGDEILAIDGQRGVGFNDLKRTILFSAEGQVLHLEVKRPGLEGPLAVEHSAPARRDDRRPGDRYCAGLQSGDRAV